MDKVGEVEKQGVFVSLHLEPDLGATVNCHVLDGVLSLLLVRLPASRFALYSCMQQIDYGATPLTIFDPAGHHTKQTARGDPCMRVENYRDFVNGLKRIPALDLNDPRIPATVDKKPKPFAEMLRSVEFYLGQEVMHGVRLQIAVHHGLFVIASNGDHGWPWEWEIAKINDDAYLLWNIAHDPTHNATLLYPDQPCAFKIEIDPSYCCTEKAVTLSRRDSAYFTCERRIPKALARGSAPLFGTPSKKNTRFDSTNASGPETTIYAASMYLLLAEWACA